MNVVYDKEKKMYVYTYNNIEVYYEEGINIQLLEEDSLICIIHTKDDCFNVISSQYEIVFDFVLSCSIELGEKRNRLNCEIGVDDRYSGFVSCLFDKKEPYSIFCTSYSAEELEKAKWVGNVEDEMVL